MRCHSNNFLTTRAIIIKVKSDIVKYPCATPLNLVVYGGARIPISKTKKRVGGKGNIQSCRASSFSMKRHFVRINAKNRKAKTRICFS